MHILSAEQFSKSWLETLFSQTSAIKTAFSNNRAKLYQRHQGKQVSLLFYEPSTRTRLSFANGAMHLGMNVSSTENARDFSSAAKGETIEDTVQVLNQYYPDIIVMRHHETGALARAAAVSQVPIINAGDGKGEHPTQSLLDTYTIYDKLGTVSNLRVVLGGDLLYGRTVRSLAKMLACFKGNHLVFVSIPELQMADDVKDYLTKHHTSFEETDSLKKACQGADVVYWTRLQKERLPAGLKLKHSLRIDEQTLTWLPAKAIILHPLPRVDEISPAIDSNPRAAYFDQAGNGMFVRMALMDQLLSAKTG